MQIRRRQRKHRKKLWTVKRKQQWKSRKKKRTSRIRSRISSSVCCITKCWIMRWMKNMSTVFWRMLPRQRKRIFPLIIYWRIFIRRWCWNSENPKESLRRRTDRESYGSSDLPVWVRRLPSPNWQENIVWKTRKRWLSLRQIPIVLRQRSSCGPMPIFWRHLSAWSIHRRSCRPPLMITGTVIIFLSIQRGDRTRMRNSWRKWRKWWVDWRDRRTIRYFWY